MMGLVNSRTERGAYSDRKTAVRSETGTARTRETKVTHKVPIMKGKRPKLPFSGDQAEEKRREKNGFSARIGRARTKRPTRMSGTRKGRTQVRTSIVLLASRSLKILIG